MLDLSVVSVGLTRLALIVQTSGDHFIMILDHIRYYNDFRNHTNFIILVITYNDFRNNNNFIIQVITMILQIYFSKTKTCFFFGENRVLKRWSRESTNRYNFW